MQSPNLSGYIEASSTPTTSTGFIPVGEGQCRVDMFRSPRTPHDAPFGGWLVSGIYVPDGTTLWNFKDEKVPGKGVSFHGLAYLSFVGDEYVLLFTISGGKKLFYVRPVADFFTITSVIISGEMYCVGGRSSRELLRLKMDASKKFSMEPFLTSKEQEWLKEERKEIEMQISSCNPKGFTAEELKKMSFQSVTLREEKVRRRKERQETILHRPKIHARTSENSSRFGIPVVGDEWMALRDRDYGIGVESYDDETNKPGPVISAFSVSKDGSRVSKMGEVLVFSRSSSLGEECKEVLEAHGVVEFDLGSLGRQQVIWFRYGRPSDYRGRIKPGTFIACGEKDNYGRFQLFRIMESEVRTIGLRSPVCD
ncbi:MAG: hypothetical protein EOM19_04225 [Candidatus Moranbacteria bacterium]|nr:hypothetical protein [Candidatus Moranbacteria bacterium]